MKTTAESRTWSSPDLTVPSRGKPNGETPGRALLQQLLDASIALPDDWEQLPKEVRTRVTAEGDPDRCLDLLVEASLLTRYQADRLKAGTTFGLIMGNYRILDRLGAGGMGVVFKGEHLLLRRQVAIKVLPHFQRDNPRLVQRFFTEMQAIARLQHPNIVAAMDAGRLAGDTPDLPTLHYLVMEYVAGQDLEQCVPPGGLPVAKACDLISQVANALEEGHKHNLVHRDIKPSNVLVTAEGQAKLLDFGLARMAHNRGLTEPGTVVGTLDYIAPEQALDASTVDIRADIFGLGGTLYFCLTGEPPFPPEGSLAQELARRQNLTPPCARTKRPDVPPELDRIVARMMAPKAEDRYATPRAVTRALLPFVRTVVREGIDPVTVVTTGADGPLREVSGEAVVPKPRRILVVDDEREVRLFCRLALTSEGYEAEEAVNGEAALQLLQERPPFDLLLLDMHMPHMDGQTLLAHLRQRPPCRNLKIIVMSGLVPADEMAQMLAAGAIDFLAKPMSLVQLIARAKSALSQKESQDRSDLLRQQMLAVNAELERTLTASHSDLVQARNALVLALAKLVEHRSNETGAHLLRIQRYCTALAEEAAATPHLAGQIDASFIEMLECCAPLHDIGNVGLPDHVLLKPGKLDPEERMIMQSHTVIGSETLKQVARRHGGAITFLRMAIDITRHHHEHYDGSGYPDRLAGENIPLAARIVTIGDVYDALRSRRAYRPGLSHPVAFQVMTEASAAQFDPILLRVFQRCAPRFERIFRELPEGTEFQ